MKKYFRELSVAGALGILLIVLAILAPSFYSPQPLLSLAARASVSLVVALGMALVIIAREIDISVGSMFAVCSVCAGLFAAIPAVYFYNHFTNKVKKFATEMDDFSLEFLNISERNFT